MVRIYAAMAVEGFLNFYGVLRLGQNVFDEHFERLGLVPKVRALLLVCDQLDVSQQDPLPSSSMRWLEAETNLFIRRRKSSPTRKRTSELKSRCRGGRENASTVWKRSFNISYMPFRTLRGGLLASKANQSPLRRGFLPSQRRCGMT